MLPCFLYVPCGPSSKNLITYPKTVKIRTFICFSLNGRSSGRYSPVFQLAVVVSIEYTD